MLGAVVSPTDPIAATAIMQRLGVPRRIVSIVEGESLVNDGTALVVYRFAVIAVVSGSFSLGGAAVSFVGTVLGVLTFALIFNLMTLMDLAVEIQLITKGVIIVAAVLLQRRQP